MGDNVVTTGPDWAAPTNEEGAGSEDGGKPSRRQGLPALGRSLSWGCRRRNLRLEHWGDGPAAGSPPPPSGVTPHSSPGLGSGEKRGNWMPVIGQTLSGPVGGGSGG